VSELGGAALFLALALIFGAGGDQGQSLQQQELIAAERENLQLSLSLLDRAQVLAQLDSIYVELRRTEEYLKKLDSLSVRLQRDIERLKAQKRVKGEGTKVKERRGP